MNRTRIAIMVAAGLLLPAIGVAPQLQARVVGDEYAVRVAPVDPLDPFRGAYVDLSYPDLTRQGPNQEEGQGGDLGSMPEGDERGPVFITLRQDGEVWVADDYLRARPEAGPYLACNDRGGIESWFLPQDEARAMQDEVSEGDLIATVRIDSRGHAALIDIT